ncbi:MAG: hypothetical protein AB1420_15990 [Bacillota bacterium]
MEKRNIIIPQDLWDAIQKDMVGKYKTVSEWVRDAIREKLRVR